jgi:protein ImuA
MLPTRPAEPRLLAAAASPKPLPGRAAASGAPGPGPAPLARASGGRLPTTPFGWSQRPGHGWRAPAGGSAAGAAPRSRAPSIAKPSDAVSRVAVLPSGHAPLDAWLPAGGWPVEGLVELLLARSGGAEWLLLEPLLRRLAAEGRSVALVAPPSAPFGDLFGRHGVFVDSLMLLPAASGAAALQQAEAAVASGQFGAVVSWLCDAALQVGPQALRPLAQAAAQRRPASGAVSIVCRPLVAQFEGTPAALRLAALTVPDGAGGTALRIERIATQAFASGMASKSPPRPVLQFTPGIGGGGASASPPVLPAPASQTVAAPHPSITPRDAGEQAAAACFLRGSFDDVMRSLAGLRFEADIAAAP